MNKSILLSICDAIPVLWHLVAIKTLEMFDRQLWSYSLEFFRGEISDSEFEQSFIDAIENQLTRAWNEGADEVGVAIEDMTEDDIAILDGLINDEVGYLTGLGVDIIDIKESTVGMSKNEALDEFRSRFRDRIDIWASKYDEMVNRAKIHFGGKTRLVWTLGATEEHCNTCSALNGIVAYAYEWEQSGITPGESGSAVLECRGFHCDCSLSETDERRSPNAFERLLDIATSGNVGEKRLKGWVTIDGNHVFIGETGGDGSGGDNNGNKDLSGVSDKTRAWAGSDDGFSSDGSHYTVYHGTTEENAESIQKEGLKPPEMTGASWFMTTTSFEEAGIFAGGYSGDAVIEFRIPTGELVNSLWKGSVVSAGDTQHAIRGSALDPKYIYDIHKIGK